MYDGTSASTSGARRALKSGADGAAVAGSGMEGYDMLSGIKRLSCVVRREADEEIGVAASAAAKSCADAVERRELFMEIRASWRKLSMSTHSISTHFSYL